LTLTLEKRGALFEMCKRSSNEMEGPLLAHRAGLQRALAGQLWGVDRTNTERDATDANDHPVRTLALGTRLVPQSDKIN
jgi:hypothetical protein